jgi:hypothetical protein
MSTSMWDGLHPEIWKIILPPVMRRLLLERLLAIAEHLPRGQTVEDLLEARDRRPLPPPLSDPEVARDLGWIEGVADAFDLTFMELMDPARLQIGPDSGLPRGKKPRYMPGARGLAPRPRGPGVCEIG